MLPAATAGVLSPNDSAHRIIDVDLDLCDYSQALTVDVEVGVDVLVHVIGIFRRKYRCD